VIKSLLEFYKLKGTASNQPDIMACTVDLMGFMMAWKKSIMKWPPRLLAGCFEAGSENRGTWLDGEPSPEAGDRLMNALGVDAGTGTGAGAAVVVVVVVVSGLKPYCKFRGARKMEFGAPVGVVTTRNCGRPVSNSGSNEGAKNALSESWNFLGTDVKISGTGFEP
jgi:hypothetical protein